MADMLSSLYSAPAGFGEVVKVVGGRASSTDAEKDAEGKEYAVQCTAPKTFYLPMQLLTDSSPVFAAMFKRTFHARPVSESL